MTRRFHPLDELVLGLRKEARAAAAQAAKDVLGDRIALGSFHITPGESLAHFLRMSPQEREQMRESLGEDVYVQYAQMQLENMSKRRGVGPVGAARLFDMLGVFSRPPLHGDATAPAGAESATASVDSARNMGPEPQQLPAPAQPQEAAVEPAAQEDGEPELEI